MSTLLVAFAAWQALKGNSRVARRLVSAAGIAGAWAITALTKILWAYQSTGEKAVIFILEGLAKMLDTVLAILIRLFRSVKKSASEDEEASDAPQTVISWHDSGVRLPSDKGVAEVRPSADSDDKRSTRSPSTAPNQVRLEDFWKPLTDFILATALATGAAAAATATEFGLLQGADGENNARARFLARAELSESEDVDQS